jgi:hypothetical protein
MGFCEEFPRLGKLLGICGHEIRAPSVPPPLPPSPSKSILNWKKKLDGQIDTVLLLQRIESQIVASNGAPPPETLVALAQVLLDAGISKDARELVGRLVDLRNGDIRVDLNDRDVLLRLPDMLRKLKKPVAAENLERNLQMDH